MRMCLLLMIHLKAFVKLLKKYCKIFKWKRLNERDATYSIFTFLFFFSIKIYINYNYKRGHYISMSKIEQIRITNISHQRGSEYFCQLILNHSWGQCEGLVQEKICNWIKFKTLTTQWVYSVLKVIIKFMCIEMTQSKMKACKVF